VWVIYWLFWMTVGDGWGPMNKSGIHGLRRSLGVRNNKWVLLEDLAACLLLVVP
jgi:hypothetical protein